MFRKTRRLLALALLFAPIDLLAQDVTGLYSLSATQNPGQNDCTWSGSLELNQTGGNPGSFTGSGAANLAIGGSPCADFQGTATGTINGSALDFEQITYFRAKQTSKLLNEIRGSSIIVSASGRATA